MENVLKSKRFVVRKSLIGKKQIITFTTKKGDQITFMEALVDTIDNSPTLYQAARNLGFLFGSRDYKDDTRDEGRPVEINLGKIEE